jgi:hypothetical protein
MSKLANHIALFCSHDNTEVLYIDWSSSRTGSKLIHLTLSSDLFMWDVILNLSIRTGLDFKSPHFDPALGFASDLIKLHRLDLKSSPVLIAGFEILHKILN